MTGDDESLHVEQVIGRLIARYPSVSAGDIEHTVRTIHKRFDNGRIRDFVPLLVEKAARRDLENHPRAAPGVAAPGVIASDASVLGEIGGRGLSPLPAPILD
ncbi:three-helix bundle dimerization domain-containing protein [Rhodococcus sp. NPDC127530]|uniref:three-helix bundle dimerization domain-containing protein n=1 Tax=unclassified Rhodococcus (in: high G+C Gram-positive bacteria) TaxID=192944 RepID=UPI00363DC111